MIMTNPTDSDKPGGDLTDHGADPADRAQDDAGNRASDSAAAPTDGEEIPAGDLTDHGVDPASRTGGQS